MSPPVRFLRVAIPLLLLGLVAAFALSFQRRPEAHSRPAAAVDPKADLGPRMEDARVVELAGSTDKLKGTVEVVRQKPDGSLLLQGVTDLEIDRGARGPLVVTAGQGEGAGSTGERMWHFEDEVVLRDPERELALYLPQLEVDEEAGFARAKGRIRFHRPRMEGEAASLTYGIHGQPGRVTQLVLRDGDGATISAAEAVLLDAFRDVELMGDVAVRRPDQQVEARTMRVQRDEADRLRHLEARGEVQGTWQQPAGLPPATMQAARMDARWDAAGALERLELAGEARLARGPERLGAQSIAVEPSPDGIGDDWTARAEGEAWARGRFAGAPGLLRATEIEAVLDGGRLLTIARARGRVSFESATTRAEAERATYSAAGDGEVRLFAPERGKARLAREQTRVAAEWISTDPAGERLVARGGVEATLLPAAAGSGERTPGAGGLFVEGEAIHFVSETLEAGDAGTRLAFGGAVRGWQGERNLSADRVELQQDRRTLAAEGQVVTRIPRDAGDHAGESDYLQIRADRLAYDDAAGVAVYRGEVRVLLDEGWLQAGRVEIDLEPGDRRVREVRAFDEVEVEFRQPQADGTPQPLSGTADRAVYRPREATVWLLGERMPATIRRSAGRGGTTTGKALRYRLDLGTLEVESGSRGPVRISTPEEAGT